MMMSLRDRKALSESKSASLMEFETKGTSEAEDDEKKLPELSNYEEERKVKRNKADEEMAKETEQKASGRMVTRSRVRNLVNKKDSSKRENEESSDKSDQSDKTDKVSSNKRVLESMDEDKDSQEEVSSPESPLAKKSKKKNEEIIVDLDEERNVSKGPLVKVKRVIKGSNEGEIRVVTSFERLKDLEQSKSDGMEKPIPSPDKIYRTYGGPRANLSEKYLSSKTVGRKYMILDKATIKEMMDKGLIQTIQKGDGSQSIASYRAVIPRSGGSSIFHQVASPVANIPVTTSTTFKTGFATSGQTMVTPSVIMTSSSVGTPVAVATSVGGIPVSGNVYRTATINPGGTSVATNASQIVTAPIYIRPHVSSAGLPITTVTTQQGDVQVVALPPDLMKQIHQIQQKGTLTDSQGSPSTFKTSTINQEIGIPRGDILTKDSENANFVHEAGEVKNDIAANTKKEMAYGVPTGVCKVLKSMKMYQYVDEKRPLVVSGANGPIKSAVRWVAVPNSSEGATFQIAGPIDKTAGGASFQPLGSPVLKTSVPLEVNVSVAKKEADANLPQIENFMWAFLYCASQLYG
ncbi:hypothetical protein SK128_026452 [Halocaridina rubra]|uniref:Uncharacterized protein n=1 Tax=Halocaridina rubra TaxID=373956 RepID=A0AAN8XG47_HALRR